MPTFGGGTFGGISSDIDVFLPVPTLDLAAGDPGLIQNHEGATTGETWTGSINFNAVTGTYSASLYWYDSSGTLLDTDTSDAITTTGRKSVTGTAPASTASVSFAVYAVDGSSTASLSLAQLEESSGATTYRVGDQTVGNNPNSSTGQGRFALFYNAGSVPAPVVTSIIGDAGANLSSTLLALRSQGGVGTTNITDYINTRKYLSWSNGSLGTDASLVGDSDTASSDALSISFASEDMLRRVRLTASTLLDAIAGEFEVFARCKSSNVSSNFNLSLHWAPSNTDPATISLPTVEFDNTDADSGALGYVDISMGRISIPSDVGLAGLAFEMWAERTEGSGSLRLDTLSFAPADECVGEVTMPTTSSSITWDSDSLVTSSSGATAVSGDPAFGSSAVSASSVLLNAANEIVSGPASSSTQGGISLPGGRARFVFSVTHSVDGAYTAIIRVVDTGPTGTDAVATYRTVTKTAYFSQSGQFELEVDTTAGEYYQPQIYLSSYTSGYLAVQSISVSITPSVTENERIYIDPDTYSVHKLDSGGSLVTPLRHTGQLPFYAPPGLSAIYMHFGDLPISGLDGTVTDLDREPTVRFTYAPMDWA